VKRPALTLKRKLASTVVLAALSLIAVLAGLWYTGIRNNNVVVEQSSEALRQNAQASLAQRGSLSLDFLAESLPNLVYYYDLKGLRDTIAPVLERPDVRHVMVYDRDGRLLHDGRGTPEGFGEIMSDALAAGVIGAELPVAQWSDELLDLSRPIMLGSVHIGGVRIGLSRAETDALVVREQAQLAAQLRQRFLAQMRRVVIAFALLLAIGIAMAAMVGRSLVRPIRALAAATDRLVEGRYDEIDLHSERSDELGVLIRAFDRMAQSLEQHDREIRRIAYQDALTGLPNRLMFRELLEQAIDTQARERGGLGLLFIDLDDFKRINDTLGHDVGDQVLGEFAQRLQALLARNDQESGDDKSLAARLGGDEFVALVSGATVRQQCHELAEGIIDSLERPFVIGGKSLFLSASIGITQFPEDARSSRHLLKCGDLAMYQAKLEGKNCLFWYSDHLTADAEESLRLEQALREAIKHERLDVAYQPLFDLKTGRMIGAEALVRWSQAGQGDIAPERLIAVAEASSLIDELGIYVLDRACRDGASWQQQLPGLRVGVNISGRQLLRRDLSELVDQSLARSGLPAECLTLELTESSLLHDRGFTSQVLKRLRERGVSVWLDDFGTGFSGLGYLRQLQVHGVKIDRSFITDLPADGDDLALTSAIIAMAHSIGMRVVAEGVESVEQLELLRQRNCDLAQGFLLARPMRAAEVPGYRPPPGLLGDSTGAAHE
jgi:diguanylate cyclase (GGDEF)-like protein